MLEFFGAVAGAIGVAAPIIANLGEIAHGGRRLFELADAILTRFRTNVGSRNEQQVIRQALSQAAAMPQIEFDRRAEEIVNSVLADRSPEDRRVATEYLKLIPARIRATFSRPEDISGQSVPANFVASRPEDIVGFLPPRLPRFKEGDTPPEASRWVLVERLGIGGFGEVWKAKSKTMQNSFSAFKFCLDPASQRSILENELENVELVKNELVDHPNIVKLMDAHLEGDTPWLQYEYIPGGDLRQLVSTWPDDISVRVALAVEKALVIADTLEHCHNRIITDGVRRAVIHRDIKPANVLVGRNGTLKITDFGISNTQAQQAICEARIATVSGMTLSTPSLVRWANTPMYASPQQMDGSKPHPSDDVHALGVMLYQMILGNVSRPLNFDYISVLERKHVCPQLITLISTCIASDREDRYQHAGELADALRMLPKKLIAEPDPGKALYDQIDEKVNDAKNKNAMARQQLDRREWAPAVATLESIFHPALRDEDLYFRAVAHRDCKRFINSLGMEFALVPKGTFWMGGADGKPGDKQVSIDHDFFVGIYPVTQGEWLRVMDKNPSHFRKGGGGAAKLTGISDDELAALPVESVSFTDCQEFLKRLNDTVKESGWMYRHLREAEWEYACRGAPTTKADCGWSYYFTTPTNTLSPQQANFSDSGLGRTSKVGLYPANSLGIHDMHGNVWEWCEDIEEGSYRVFRGGSWDDSAENCRAASRYWYAPTRASTILGLRVARVSSGSKSGK